MVCLFLKSLPDLYRGDWLQTTPGKSPRSCKAKSPLNLLLFSGKSLQYCWLSASFILIYSIGKLKAHGLHFSPIGIWNGQQLYLLWVNAQSFQLGLTLCDPMGCSLPGSIHLHASDGRCSSLENILWEQANEALQWVGKKRGPLLDLPKQQALSHSLSLSWCFLHLSPWGCFRT